MARNQNSVLSLLLSSPNINVNLKTKNHGGCALHFALYKLPESPENNDALKLLLDAPTIDVNRVDTITGQSAVNRAVSFKRIEGLKLLLSHPRLTNLSINKKDIDGNTPVMLAMKQADYPATSLANRYLEVLAADLRVDLDTTDNEGRSLEEVAVAYGEYYFHCCPRVAKAIQNFIALASLALLVHFIALACCV